MLALLPLARAVGPVVLLPGLLSNQLDVELKDFKPPHAYCEKTCKKYRAYLNLATVTFPEYNCWLAQMELEVSAAGVTDKPGVIATVPGFGDTATSEMLDPSIKTPPKLVAYAQVWAHMATALRKKGYKSGYDLRAAPHDWRYAPGTARGDQYARDVRALVEETANATGGRVMLVSHSLGGLWAEHILRNAEQSWKDAYVRGWVSIASPVGGAVMPLQGIGVGFNDGVFTVPSSDFQVAQATWPSMWWLAASARGYNTSDVVATAPGRTYTLADVPQLMKDLKVKHVDALSKLAEKFRYKLEPLGTKVYCFVADNVKTPVRMEFKDTALKKYPHMQTTQQGDGMVEWKSLELCKKFEPEVFHTFQGIQHLDMIKKPESIDAILRFIGSPKESEIIV